MGNNIICLLLQEADYQGHYKSTVFEFNRQEIDLGMGLRSAINEL
jgi:hypothetical protein